MRRSNLHSIHSESIVATIASADRAHAIAATLRDAATGKLGDALEEAFDRTAEALGLGEATLRIERLELHASGTSVEEAIERLVPDLARALIDAVKSAGREVEPRDVVVVGTTRVTAEHVWDEALIQLLVERQLPWAVLQRTTAELRAALGAAARRLWQSAEVIERLMLLARTDRHDERKRRLSVLLRLHEPSEHELAEVLERVADQTSRALAPTEASDSITDAPRGRDVWAARLADALAPPEATSPHAEGAPSPTSRDTEAEGNRSSNGDASAPTTPPPTAARSPVHSQRPTNIAERERSPSDARGERVHAAGLVILHPFLPAFFAHLDLLSAPDRHIPIAALDRAASALAFLATGDDAPFEHELGFIRQLLAAPASLSLGSGNASLSQAERDEATALLEAVIGHWPALRRTSPDGLREGFLRRMGTLYRGASNSAHGNANLHAGDRLVVDSAAHDILLSSLPWTVSIVRLPWMTTPLMIDWPTP